MTSIHGDTSVAWGADRCAGERTGGQFGVDAPLPASGDQQPDGQQVVAVELEVTQVAARDELAAGAEVVGQRDSSRLDGSTASISLFRRRHCSRSSANQCSADGAPRSTIEGVGGPPGCDDGTRGAAATSSTPARGEVFVAGREAPPTARV